MKLTLLSYRDAIFQKTKQVFARVLGNSIAKKSTIFAAVFALTCVLMGNSLDSANGEDARLASLAVSLREGQAAMMQELERAMNFQTRVDFPFGGEYPAVSAQPLPVKPMVDVNIPTAEGFIYSPKIPLSLELQQYTYTSCVQKGLEYELVLALMWRESRFQIDAVNINTNGTQDSGIMQINDVNRAWLKAECGIENLMDPVQNIEAGTTMLSSFVQKYGVHDALMAYQYGEQGMQRKIRQGVVTNDLIAILLDQRDVYRSILQQT